MINFKSKITQKVLPYFFLNQDKELYLNEMARKFGVDRANLSRKLSEWTLAGILEKNQRGNLSLYKINKKYPLLSGMAKMIQKSFGLEQKMRHSLERIKGLEAAYIFGSYACDGLGAESDIDLLLVGSHDFLSAQKEIVLLQRFFDREINVIDMTGAEFNKKKKSGLIKNILADKNIRLL